MKPWKVQPACPYAIRSGSTLAPRGRSYEYFNTMSFGEQIKLVKLYSLKSQMATTHFNLPPATAEAAAAAGGEALSTAASREGTTPLRSSAGASSLGFEVEALD